MWILASVSAVSSTLQLSSAKVYPIIDGKNIDASDGDGDSGGAAAAAITINWDLTVCVAL